MSISKKLVIIEIKYQINQNLLPIPFVSNVKKIPLSKYDIYITTTSKSKRIVTQLRLVSYSFRLTTNAM